MSKPETETPSEMDAALLALFPAEGPEDDPEDEASPKVVAALERFWRTLAQRYAKERDELRAALRDGYFINAEEFTMLRAIEAALDGGRARTWDGRRDLAGRLSRVVELIAERKLVP